MYGINVKSPSLSSLIVLIVHDLINIMFRVENIQSSHTLFTRLSLVGDYNGHGGCT